MGEKPYGRLDRGEIQFYVKSLHLKTRFFAFISTRVFDLYIVTHQPQYHALLLGK
jgi:hypothetical protein